MVSMTVQNDWLIKMASQNSDTWENTAVELTAISYEMDVIHQRYNGKENKTERDLLLGPLRVKCIGKRRQALVNTSNHLTNQMPVPACLTHTDAPHGFNRNASHTNNRYTCDCEGWVADN